MPPSNPHAYARLVKDITLNPVSTTYCGGMTYLYHADAFKEPLPSYDRIKTPFLVVIGTQDPLFHSTEIFVKKGKSNGMPIAYLKVPGMDHYIRKRPEIISQSFNWLKSIMQKTK